MARRKSNQRKDKRYMVRLDLGNDAAGKRLRKYFYGDTLGEAENKRSEWLALRENTKAVPDCVGITFSQWAERWLSSYGSGLSYNVCQNRKYRVNVLCAFVLPSGKTFGGMPMVEIMPEHVRQVLGATAGKSKGVILHTRFVLRSILDAAVENRIIASNPFGKIKAARGTYTGHRALDGWEKDIITQTWSESRAGLWAALGLYTGLRRGELAALTWEDVNLTTGLIQVNKASYFEHNQLRIKDTKTEAGNRSVPILPPLRPILEQAHKDTGYVCADTEGKPLSEMAWRRGWDSWLLVCERAANGIQPYAHTIGWRKDKARKKEGHKVVDITPHDLRYTYATLLFDAGVDVKTAQYLLGHTDLMTTMKIYTKLSDEKKKKSIDSLFAYFAPKNEAQI